MSYIAGAHERFMVGPEPLTDCRKHEGLGILHTFALLHAVQPMVQKLIGVLKPGPRSAVGGAGAV